MVRLDVWGGECSQDHLARFHFPLETPLWMIASGSELRGGYLVNLRQLGPGEAPDGSFDVRGNA